MSWTTVGIVVAAVVAVVAAVLGFDRLMLLGEARRQQARRDRPPGQELPPGASMGAFGVGFEVWQPGYKSFVDEQQRQDQWIDYSKSAAPPHDVDLDKGVARITLPKRPS